MNIKYSNAPEYNNDNNNLSLQTLNKELEEIKREVALIRTIAESALRRRDQ